MTDLGIDIDFDTPNTTGNPSTWFAPAQNQEVIMVSGLPAAGKTYWTRHYQRSHSQVGHNPQPVRISRTEIGAMMGLPSDHGFVGSMFRQMLMTALRAGKTVICDDYNLDPEIRTELENLVAFHNHSLDTAAYDREVLFRAQELNGVGLDALIARDLARTPSVGPETLRALWRKYHPVTYASASPLAKPALVIVADGLLRPADTGYEPLALPIVDLIGRYASPDLPLDRRYAAIWISTLGPEARGDLSTWMEEQGLPCEMLLLADPLIVGAEDEPVDQVMYAWNAYVIGAGYATMAVFDLHNVTRWQTNAILTLQAE